MKIRTLGLVAVVVGLVFTAEFAGAFQPTHVCYLENGRKVRAECFREVATPTPIPSPSPHPTVAPVDCESIAGEKRFTVGQDRTLCFTAGPGATFVEVAATSPANVGCAYFRTELTSPSGLKSYGEGAYPMGTVLRTSGKHYFWVSPLWIADGGGCDTYTFTVR